ncbi:ABC transporter ATP-binding protein [Cetobacterium sp.]|uniref:ABC transporter ATP-binding protein n=1 Tax=Cetobacterium sp. TaxID=2071632 RepID=UPI003F2B2A16
MEENELLKVENLKTYFFTRKGVIKAVDDVSFSLSRKRTLGVVGESGSGKSITALSILRLLEIPGDIVDGNIIFKNKNLVKISEEEMQHLRGNDISMIFQEPMTSLNPVLKIGFQIEEVLRLHQKLNKKDSPKKAIEMLKLVGIPRPRDISESYPHQLSGGMRQRVMIAIALSCNPQILIADEPTTALDVTIQSQILAFMNSLKEELGTSIIFITHDLGVIAEMADDVIVMYCGQVVESASVNSIFEKSSKKHPYTRGLLNSVPNIDDDKVELEVIEGSVPNPLFLPKGCRFAPRCKYAMDICKNFIPELLEVEKNHKIRCLYVQDGGNYE